MTSKRTLPLFFILGFLLINLPLYAQKVEITGKITQKGTGEPIPHAHVRVDEVITYTNINGEFILLVPRQIIHHPLEVFHIGYDTYSETITEESDSYKLDIALEKLDSKNTPDQGLTGEDIMREVFYRFHTNYDMEDQLMLSYYKETLTGGGELHHIAEGILEVHIPSNVENTPATLRPLKTRVKTLKDTQHKGVNVKSGHATEMVQSSIWINNSFLLDKNRWNYAYTLSGMEVHRDEDIYIIDFEPANPKGYIHGKLFIDKNSYAIIRMEYYPSAGSHWDDEKWVEDFQHHDHVYYLLRASYEGHWEEDGEEFVFYSLIVNTEIESDVDSSISRDEFIQGKDFTFRAGDEGRFSESYWGPYNHILLTEDETSQLRK